MEKTFKSPNINCGHCVRTITREVGGIAGVEKVEVDAATKTVTVKWSDPPATWAAIEAVLTEINCPPEK